MDRKKILTGEMMQFLPGNLNNSDYYEYLFLFPQDEVKYTQVLRMTQRARVGMKTSKTCTTSMFSYINEIIVNFAYIF